MKFCAKVVVFRGIAYEEGAEAIWCICWWGASPQIAGKGELASGPTNTAKSFGGNLEMLQLRGWGRV